MLVYIHMHVAVLYALCLSLCNSGCIYFQLLQSRGVWLDSYLLRQKSIRKTWILIIVPSIVCISSLWWHTWYVTFSRLTGSQSSLQICFLFVFRALGNIHQFSWLKIFLLFVTMVYLQDHLIPTEQWSSFCVAKDFHAWFPQLFIQIHYNCCLPSVFHELS